MMNVSFEGWVGLNKRRYSKAREWPCDVDRLDPFGESLLGLDHDNVSSYRLINPTNASFEKEEVMAPKGQSRLPKRSDPGRRDHPDLFPATDSIRKYPCTRDLS